MLRNRFMSLTQVRPSFIPLSLFCPSLSSLCRLGQRPRGTKREAADCSQSSPLSFKGSPDFSGRLFHRAGVTTEKATFQISEHRRRTLPAHPRRSCCKKPPKNFGAPRTRMARAAGRRYPELRLHFALRLCSDGSHQRQTRC